MSLWYLDTTNGNDAWSGKSSASRYFLNGPMTLYGGHYFLANPGVGGVGDRLWLTASGGLAGLYHILDLGNGTLWRIAKLGGDDLSGKLVSCSPLDGPVKTLAQLLALVSPGDTGYQRLPSGALSQVYPSINAVTPSGIISLPMQHLKTLLRATADWQTIEDAAGDHVRFCEVSEDEDRDLRPWALIDQGSEWEMAQNATGTANEFLHTGTLMLRFTFDVDSGYGANAGDAQLSITNQIGSILTQMLTLAGSSGYLMVNSIRLVELGRTAPEHRASEGDFVSMMFEVGWGLA